MKTELLKIETYNEGGNRVECIFRKLYAEYPEVGQPFLTILLEEVHTGVSGHYKVPLALSANNAMQVPVFRVGAGGQPEPVMVEPTPGLDPADPLYRAPFQHTIGEFDMWRVLIFEGNHVSINAAITAGVMRKKGLITTPLAFLMP